MEYKLCLMPHQIKSYCLSSWSGLLLCDCNLHYVNCINIDVGIRIPRMSTRMMCNCGCLLFIKQKQIYRALVFEISKP